MTNDRPANLRLDETGFGSLKIYQDPSDFCYGIDAVILADFASETKGDNIIDLGCGNGIIPLILSHKLSKGKITGIELRQSAYQLAQKNIEYNGLAGKIRIINSDIKNFSEKNETYSTVVMNPPYMASGSGQINDDNISKMTARHETTATLNDFLQTASRLLINKGELYMIHRPARTVEIINGLTEYGLEPKILRYVSPKEGKDPNIMLLKAIKNGGSELTVRAPLYVHKYDGSYTDEIMRIYERV